MKHALVTLSVLTAALAAQGPPVAGPPSGLDPAALFAWPTDFATSAFAAVRDAQGNVVARRVLAAGTADFDHDHNGDAWILTDAGAGASQLHTLMANTADLGRFWSWVDYAAAARPDAATYHSVAGSDVVLLVDPAADRLDHRCYLPNASAPDPRLSGTWAGFSGWLVGLGCFELETADFDGDGHDDLALLRDLGNGATELKLIAMGSPFGGPPMPVSEITLTLPVPLQTLRILDVDGDGRMDAGVNVPGLGVAIFAQTQTGLVLHTFLPIGSGVRDLCAGDVDRDRRDDLAVVLDAGVLLLGTTTPMTALLNPPGVGALAGGAILDADHDGRADVVAVPASGTGLVVHRREAQGFVAPRWHAPTTLPAGSGVTGLAAFRLDVDRDGDLDLAVQLRDGSFTTLRATANTLAPVHVHVVHEGRYSESYISERLDLTLSPLWRAAGFDQVEVGIYMRHPQDPARPWVLWARQTFPLADDLASEVLRVRLLYLVDRVRLPLLTNPYLYPGGIAVFGDTMVTVHAKTGTRRGESMLIHHEGRSDENKSTLGVQWKVMAAPPMPRTDAQLLPFD